MDEQYLSMKSWAEDERPRERLMRLGASELSLNELFAILLRSGINGKSAVEVARRILADHHNDLNRLARCTVRELMSRYKGVGIAKAAAVVAAIEIGRRRGASDIPASPVIRCSTDAYNYLRPFMADLEHEEFWVIYMTLSNRVRGCECLSSGGMGSTVIDVRMLFRKALDSKACNIIVAHNHPSGTLRPSTDDEAVTRKIFEGGNLLDIKLCDHIIICENDYFSFADEGLLIFSGKG